MLCSKLRRFTSPVSCWPCAFMLIKGSAPCSVSCATTAEPVGPSLGFIQNTAPLSIARSAPVFQLSKSMPMLPRAYEGNVSLSLSPLAFLRSISILAGNGSAEWRCAPRSMRTSVEPPSTRPTVSRESKAKVGSPRSADAEMRLGLTPPTFAPGEKGARLPLVQPLFRNEFD